MTFDPVPFDLGPAVVHWLLVVGSVAGIALVLSLVAAVFGGGRPRLFGTISSVVRGVTEGVSDFIHLSPRRVWAIATLTWKEAYRRKALLVFVIFALLFMFGGWFLSDTKLLADVQDVCDRIAILYAGELKVMGKVDELLKEQDETQLLTSRLSDGAIKEIESVLNRHGAELHKVDHPTASLEDLFLKTVDESIARPGRRFIPEEEPAAVSGNGGSQANPEGASQR